MSKAWSRNRTRKKLVQRTEQEDDNTDEMTVIRASSNEAEAHFETSGGQTDACNPRVLLLLFVSMNP